ncbi:hypothetical protein QDR37_01240 [Amnibacterium sp. CER49]|uniref:hypothetical protein n=1 Tax=Amnibacterium sp. CER49 TaxID=3039161 RepID=UPI002449D132|nr:hypothetical protein [Amnibacterium sp. CER49]MDH2442558.1 hypothetical protein [Amnibacterium sp. CER49]
MTDAEDDSPFQQIYDWLVLSDAQWTNPFHGGNEIARKWAGTAVERLATMASGQEIQFAVGGFTTDGFDTTASATVFTKHMRLELAPTTLRGGTAWQPSKVVASPRAALYEATLLESNGPAEKPWSMVLELRYKDRNEPVRIESGTSVHGNAAPVFAFLPSLLADVGRR